MSGLLVHEWVAEAGGSENVLHQFAELYPDADIQVLWSDDPTRFPRKVYDTWLARSPLRRHKALSVPFLPITWRLLTAHRDYDWMLVSSHMFAHHIRLTNAPDLAKLVYCHTPARYIWSPEIDPRGAGQFARFASKFLKPIDRRRAGEATDVAANSEFTRARVQNAWQRDARIIYPPVDTERIQSHGRWSESVQPEELSVLEKLPDEFVLGASRFVPYKRLDLVIEAGEAMGLPVVIAGSGPLQEELRLQASTATVPVTIVDRPSDEMLFSLYQAAVAYVFPAVEDFGIMPVEAMAAGCPVIVPAVGGAAETAKLLSGGALMDAFGRQEWRSALGEATSVDRSRLQERATVMSCTRFRAEVAHWVREQAGAD